MPLLPADGVVVDLCCGCGALGTALAARRPGVEVHAADVDPVAVACARRNLATVGGRAYCGDLFEPLPAGLRGRVDVLVANVPYVPTDEIALLPAEARLFEPRVTLDGGADGLAVLTRVAGVAPGWLAPGGSVLCETSERQCVAALAIFAAQGLVTRAVTDEDLAATVVMGTMPG
jgi:release factor glutamine methyltransferase